MTETFFVVFETCWKKQGIQEEKNSLAVACNGIVQSLIPTCSQIWSWWTDTNAFLSTREDVNGSKILAYYVVRAEVYGSDGDKLSAANVRPGLGMEALKPLLVMSMLWVDVEKHKNQLQYHQLPKKKWSTSSLVSQPLVMCVWTLVKRHRGRISTLKVLIVSCCQCIQNHHSSLDLAV